MRPDLLPYFDAQVRQKESAFAAAYRAQLGAGEVKRVTGPFPAEAHNWIGYHHFEAAEAEAIIAEQIAAFEAIGHSFRWKVYDHDAPAELPAMLLERGFVRTDTSALMVIESEACQGARPDGIDYVALVKPEALATELRPIADAVWDDGPDELIAAFAMELREAADHMALFAAKESGETIGFGLVRYDRDFAFGGLFAGNTVPRARGRGIYRGMVAVRAKDALERGAEHLYTEAGPMSRPILEHIGFTEISTVSNYAYPAASR